MLWMQREIESFLKNNNNAIWRNNVEWINGIKVLYQFDLVFRQESIDVKDSKMETFSFQDLINCKYR